MSARRTRMTHSAYTIAIGIILLLSVTPASAEPLVIAVSPTVAGPVQALSRAFETAHPDVSVQLVLATGLTMRQTIATIENRGPYFIGTGPIHLIAPGGDELIARLQQKYYVLPGTTVSYAMAPLVLVVPESLVEAPSSFDALAHSTDLRVAIADPTLTVLGTQTLQLLRRIGAADKLSDRLDVAADAASVLDHLLHGKADVAIVYGQDAILRRDLVRIVATASDQVDRPVIHSMAMSRSCPNRTRCDEFLKFLRSPEARRAVKALGYLPVSVMP